MQKTEPEDWLERLSGVRVLGVCMALIWIAGASAIWALAPRLNIDSGEGLPWYLMFWIFGTAWLGLWMMQLYRQEKSLLEGRDLEVGMGEVAKEERAFLLTVMDALPHPTVVIRPDHSITLLNAAARQQYLNRDYADESLPKCYQLLHHQSEPCAGVDHPCPLEKVMQTGRPETVLHRHFDSAGNDVYVQLEAAPIRDAEGGFAGIVETQRDITVEIRKQREQRNQVVRLAREVHVDSLTRLPNRGLLKDRLTQALLRASRSKSKLAVLFLDLDNFKQINDLHGHEAGDAVLLAAAERIRKCVRKSDTVVRYAGDEFVIVLDQLNSVSSPAAVARKILKLLEELIYLNNDGVCATASIGISLYPDDGLTVEDLLRRADSAMYDAKRNGGNQLQYFHRMQRQPLAKAGVNLESQKVTRLKR